MEVEGSPPRVRVVPDKYVGANLLVRITPACAGSTLAKKLGLQSFKGSPPRVRVVQFIESLPKSPLGITPACAGSTEHTLSQSFVKQDHPRVCG